MGSFRIYLFFLNQFIIKDSMQALHQVPTGDISKIAPHIPRFSATSSQTGLIAPE